MMNNNSHQYVCPPPAVSSVSMNTLSTGEKMNGDNNNNIGALPSDGVPSSSGISGAFDAAGKYYHATTPSTNEEREVEVVALREAASSSIMSSTASIIMMNNNTVDAPQPSMASPMVPLAYQQQPVDGMAVGFMSTLGGGGGALSSGGLMPSYQQQHHQQVQRQEVQQRQAHAYQQQPHRNQHQHQHQHRQQVHAQQQVQQHNNRLTWRNGEKTFPYKVYDMLEYAVMNGFENVCSWTVVDDNVDAVDSVGGGGSEGGGDAFVIHNRELFTETVLPKFFMHKNWRSFTRQLNIWCFKRTYTNNYTRGVAKSDCYSHPNFKRHRYDEIGLVTRSESKGAFKKDPLTKRRIQVMNDGDVGCIGGGGEITSTAATSSSAAETSSVTINNNNNNIGGNKRRRSQQDMHEVATFLAGLKSNTTTTTSDKERNNNDSIKGEGSQLTLSSPGLHAAAYQDAVLELQQQLQKEEEEVECNVDNTAQYCSLEPPPEGTLWTCEKCKVAQFVVFDEAVEHERHCTY